MNFKRLLKIQKGLDKHIGESKGLDMSAHVVDRNVALMIEFNEFLNEVPELFKYWSNKKMDRDKALEEYVDGIHFLLSLANDLGVEGYEYTEPDVEGMSNLILTINGKISRLLETKDFESLMNDFLYLGYYLGFTDTDIEEHYEEKNKENYARQDRGY